jgi:flagellar motor switch protein FliN/FliY
MDSEVKELSQKASDCFSEATASVFSMLTGRDFTITPKEAQMLDHASVDALHQDQAVFVKAHYTKGLSGTLLFALPLKEGTILVDLMLGGEGTPATELAGDSRDALAETFNQSMGSANQNLSEMAGETLSISNVDIFAHSPGDSKGLEDILGAGPFLDIPLATVQDSLSTTIHVLFPDMLVQQLKRKLGLDGAAAPQMPHPKPEVESQPSREPSPAASGAHDLASTVAVSIPRPAAPAPIPLAQASNVDQGNLDLLLDIELPVMVRMGQTEMQLGELLKLTPGSILELNRAADAPVELLVNNKQIAKGEVVVVDGNFAFRITEIESTAARIRSLA